jgi:hypothetical protein
MLKRTLLLGLSLLALAPAILAQALLFNGASDFVKIPSSRNLQLRNFTLEAWVYIAGPGSTTGTGNGQGFEAKSIVPLITKGRAENTSTTASLNYFLGFRASDRKLVADFVDTSAAKLNHPFVGTQSLPLHTWTHVAVTYNRNGTWKMYINGKQDALLSLGQPCVPLSGSTANVAFGTALNMAGAPEGFFKGKMDEVRIWNKVRSASEVMAGHNQELSFAPGLVSRYSLNENNGSFALNSVTIVNHGALVNNPKRTTGYNGFVINKAPEAPVLATSVNQAVSSSTTSANLCVSVKDPEDRPVTVSFYGRKKTSAQKFTMVLLPDPQYYVAEPQGTGYIKGAYNIMFKSQTRWIAANRADRNIVYVGGLGDCTDHGDRFSKEWKRVDTAIKTLEDPALTGLPEGIPYGLPVGNHDQAPRGDANGTTYFFNKFFGASRFAGKSYYGGHYGINNDNHFQFFKASGIDFLVICPEWDMSSGFSAPGRVLDWMENLVKTYPNHKVIILSHYLINLSANFTPQGKAIYNRLKTYPNLMLLAAGHVVNENTGAGEARRSDVYEGRTVHTITQDYQARYGGGNGLLRIYEFDPSKNKVDVQTYSPYTNKYETDENSQFTLDVDLGKPSTDTTDFKLINRRTGISSGNSTCFNWQDLEPNTEYEWYARVYDGQYSVKGETYTFTTGGEPTSKTANTIINPTTGSTAATDRITESLPEQPVTNGFKVFPNPNSTRFVSVGLQEALPEGNIEIYNISGQVVLKKRITGSAKVITFEHNLASGMYKVVVRKSDNAILNTSNFIINRQ